MGKYQLAAALTCRGKSTITRDTAGATFLRSPLSACRSAMLLLPPTKLRCCCAADLLNADLAFGDSMPCS